MVSQATFEPFPNASFALIMVGLGVSLLSSIATTMAALLGVVLGTAAALLSRKSRLVFAPPDASTDEKRRFLRMAAISSCATAFLIVPAFAYVLSKFMGFIVPAVFVLRAIAVLCYLGGLCIVIGVAFFIVSGKFE